MLYLWANGGHPRTNCLLHTQQHTTYNKNRKHRHHGPPPSHWLPASSILQVGAIAVCCAIDHDHCNPGMYFFDDTIFSFIYFDIILYAAAQHACWQKVSFKDISYAFLCRCIETMRTNPSYPVLPYLAMLPEYSSCFGLILDRGGGHHWHDVLRKVYVGWVVGSVALLILVNT